MNTRIKLRRTQSSIDAINSKLKEGEALYSFQDKALVIGDGDGDEGTRANELSTRFFAHPRDIATNLFFTGGGSGGFPVFRTLTVNDLPDGIPASKISNDSGFVTIDSVKNKGSATQPVYFNSNGVAQPCSYTLGKSVPSNAIFNYTAGTGISISGSTISNSGVLEVTDGTVAETIRVKVGNSYSNAKVYGLSSLYAKAATNSTAAATAVKLQTARKLKVSLNSTADKTFDGTADVLNIPVTGTLQITNGGTGNTEGKIEINKIVGSNNQTSGVFGCFAKQKASAAVTTSQLRNIYAGTTDLIAGTSTLEQGTIYLMYE